MVATLNRLLSIFFRSIIVLYSMIILLARGSNFDWYWYVLATLLYILIFYLTLNGNGLFLVARLMADYVYMYFILIGKPIDFLAFAYLILPIVNSPNQPVGKISILLYIFFLLTVFFLNKFESYWSLFFICGVLFFNNFVIESKNKYYDSSERLNRKIEEFLEDQLNIKQSYKVYKGILEVLNSTSLLPGLSLRFTKIVCFKLDEKEFKFVNSSQFIWSYSISVSEGFLNNNTEEFQIDIPLTLNDTLCNQNFSFRAKTKDSIYLFVFFTSRSLDYLTVYYYVKLLRPVVLRIARVIVIDNALVKENRKLLDEFKSKYFYIQNAEKAMHFIRNKFINLDNFLEMSKDHIDGNMDSKGVATLTSELDRVAANYKLLLERASLILSKSEKPFSAIQVTSKSPMYLFKTIRDIWIDHYSEDLFVNNWKLDAVDLYYVRCNSDGLYILLSDWIVNMKKYSIGEESVQFKESQISYEIILRNKFRTQDKFKLMSIREDYNAKERDRILQRTSHGVTIMKAIVEEMGALSEIQMERRHVNFLISFKKEQNENSNLRERV